MSGTLRNTGRIHPHEISLGRCALRDLCDGFFDDFAWIQRTEVVTADDMPVTARDLLVHEEHMTTRLREHHECGLRMEVLAHQLDGDFYSRKILLTLEGRGEVVEFGIVRIDLRSVPTEARTAILARRMPLGDVLAQHRVLTAVEPRTYLRFATPGPVVESFRREGLSHAYGRLATIHCNGQAAVELLEVVPA